jgi:hypothetical protein
MTEEEKLALEKENGTKTIEEIQLATIDEMKKKMDSMVDPEEHKKLQAEYKKMMTDYVNKRPAPTKKEVVLRPTKDIAKELVNIESGDVSNREYIAKTLEYRNAHIHEFGTDPFADGGEDGAGESTPDSIEVAKVLAQLVDENQSPVDFRIKLNSVLKDDSKLVSALNKRKNKK